MSRSLQTDYVRVAEQPDLSFEVLLDYASPQDAEVFVRSYREIFAPLADQRYLIRRTDRRLPHIWLMPLWLALRRLSQTTAGHPPAYYPVPTVLAVNKERAQAFADSWSTYVGGGELVYTRGQDGWRLLLEARPSGGPKSRPWPSSCGSEPGRQTHHYFLAPPPCPVAASVDGSSPPPSSRSRR